MIYPRDLSAQVVHFAPCRPVTDAQFEKILADIEANGQTLPVPSGLTTAFGLTREGETLAARQVAYLGAAKSNHTIVQLWNGNYLLSSANTLRAHVHYVDNDRVLIAALIETAQDGVSILPNGEAQKGLDAELTFLGFIADRL